MKIDGKKFFYTLHFELTLEANGVNTGCGIIVGGAGGGASAGEENARCLGAV